MIYRRRLYRYRTIPRLTSGIDNRNPDHQPDRDIIGADRIRPDRCRHLFQGWPQRRVPRRHPGIIAVVGIDGDGKKVALRKPVALEFPYGDPNRGATESTPFRQALSGIWRCGMIRAVRTVFGRGVGEDWAGIFPPDPIRQQKINNFNGFDDINKPFERFY